MGRMGAIIFVLASAGVLLVLGSNAKAGGDHDKPSPKAPPTVQQPQRILDVPRRLNVILRDLKVGQFWVARNNDFLVAFRTSLEIEGKVIAAMTLDPSNGQPVAYSQRGNFRPNTLPSETLSSLYLRNLRQEAQSIKFGSYVLPSPRGLEVQVYWSNQLVSYMYLDPNNGNAVTDEASNKELATAPVRLR